MTTPAFTPQQELDFYYLVRNIQWRYRLDAVEDEVIARISALLTEMRSEISGRALAYAEGSYTRARLEALLAEVEIYSVATQRQITAMIAESAGLVGEHSLKEQFDILSIGGRAMNVRNVSLEAGAFGALLLDSPLGGRSLQDWVGRAFGEGQGKITDAIKTGLFQGEGYRKIVRRILGEAENITLREATTLARTYVQSASVSAQEAVYEANKDILGGVEWSAVMEPGYTQTGRGTCSTCAALDGQRWKIGEARPDCPLHPRCRCFLLPVVDWERIGIPELGLREAVRPYTIRPDESIDAGGRREILEVGQAAGSWGKWAAGRSDEFKVNAIGPARVELWRGSGLGFEEFIHRMVNRRTGELYTVKQLEAML